MNMVVIDMSEGLCLIKGASMSKLNHNPLNTPYWRFEPEVALANYRQFTRVFPGADIAYAYKSNPHLSIGKKLNKANSHFCVVSKGHLAELLDMGVPPSKIVYSHVVKSLDEIEFAITQGIFCFACDSIQEVNKLAFISDRLSLHNPIEIFVRLEVDNTGSVIPLTGKFGIGIDEVLDLLAYAHESGLKPVGFTFHIGSQCLNVDTWLNAIRRVAKIWRPAQALYDVNFLNIGGGFTGHYANSEHLPLADLASTLIDSINEFLPGVKRLVIEPGRAISGTAASLMTSVTGVAERSDGKTWLFLDAGVFNGLFETMDGLEYPITLLPAPADSIESDFQGFSSRNRLKTGTDKLTYEYMLAGPTCDSVDKMFLFNARQEVRIGDRLLFQNTGAYGYSLECDFNGYRAPGIEVISNQLVSILPSSRIEQSPESTLVRGPC